MYRILIKQRCLNGAQRIAFAFNSSGTLNQVKVWHNEDFMKNADVDEKISWLLHLIQERPSEVDIKAYNFVIKSIASAARPGAPHNIENIISQISVEPDDECYEYALEAWVTSISDSGEICCLRAEKWFHEIKNPSLTTYHLLKRHWKNQWHR
jgi:hypothetical protein